MLYPLPGFDPPDIWALGNLDIFKRKAVGFCGSRAASERGLAVAADCAQQLSQAHVAVVSGYAAGVDMASHEAALKSGGETIIVLPEGIDHFRIKRAVKPLWDWKRVLVVSQFVPNAIWRADRAMERNKVIIGLSSAIIVLEARDKGGTLNCGHSALKMGKPLFVAMYDEMNGAREGNQQLIDTGGVPLRRSRTTSHAQMRSIFEKINVDYPAEEALNG
jgi:DNA protecting protein DprA